MSARNHPNVEFAALLPEGARVVACDSADTFVMGLFHSSHTIHRLSPAVTDGVECACNLDGKPLGRPRVVVAHRVFQLSPIGVDVPERRG